MRSLLFLLFAVKATIVFAQVNVKSNIDLAATYCTDLVDPDNCISVPNDRDSLIYVPNRDGDIVISYRLQNNGGQTISQVTITDSRMGLVLPLTTVSIAPGQNMTWTVRFDSIFVAEITTSIVTFNMETSTGNPLNVNSTYYLEVQTPQAEIDVSLNNAKGFCPNTTNAANCPTIPDSIGRILEVHPGEQYVVNYKMTNIGAHGINHHIWKLTDGTPIINNSGSISLRDPGQSYSTKDFHYAPTTPGTYHFTVVYTGKDIYDNEVSTTLTYTLNVTAPEAEIEISLNVSEGFCPNTTNAANCPTIPDSIGRVLEVYPGEQYVVNYKMTNIGAHGINLHIWKLTDGTPIINNNGLIALIDPGQSISTRDFHYAPTTPGTYNFTVVYTGKDIYDNEVVKNETYTLVVASTPSTAIAGADQLICSSNTILEGNIPSFGTGSWDIISGNGGSINDNSVPNSTFTGIAGTTYELEWTIENGGVESKDIVVVRLMSSNEAVNDNYLSFWSSFNLIQGKETVTIMDATLANNKEIYASDAVLFEPNTIIEKSKIISVDIRACPH